MGVQERRQRERAARRDAVLEATRSLVRERGFNGTTTKEIAKACELSEATLFNYFKSKDEIFTSLLVEGIEAMRAGLDEIEASDVPPRDKIARLWRYFSKLEREHSEYFHVFAYLAHPRSTELVSEEVRDDLARRSGDNFRKLVRILEQVPGVEQPRAAADLLWGAFVGLMVLRDSRVNLGARAQPSARALSTAFDMLLRGVAPAVDEP